MPEHAETLLSQLRTSAGVLPKFWSAIALASPGPDGASGDLSFSVDQYRDLWPQIQRLFVLHMALVEGVEDWGLLGLEVEAAVRARVVLQAADEQALQPGLGWPPVFPSGGAAAPREMLTLGSIIAERIGLGSGIPTYGIWNPEAWATTLVPLITGSEGGSLAFHADARWRRGRLDALDAGVELWARQGTTKAPDDELWDALDDDGLVRFLADRGTFLFGHHDLEAQLRGAVCEAYEIGAGDITSRAQWLAALRLALRGDMALRAAEMMGDLRPWPHDGLLVWLQNFLEMRSE